MMVQIGLDGKPESQLSNITLMKSFMQSYVCVDRALLCGCFYETMDRWRLVLNFCPAEISVFLLAGKA